MSRSPTMFLLWLAAVIGLPASAAAQKSGEGSDCLIQPKIVLKLGTQVPGLISEMLVDRGTIVKKGDIIARIESGVEEAALALAKARAERRSARRRSSAEVTTRPRGSRSRCRSGSIEDCA